MHKTTLSDFHIVTNLDFLLTQSVQKELDNLSNVSNLSHLIPDSNSLNIDLKPHLNALIHSSFVQEFKGEIENNERLEFLGDSVLQLLVSNIIYKKFPNLDEGKLSKFRAALVNEESLYALALCSNLHEYIIFGKGEVTGQIQEKSGPLSDLLEALLGSVYELSGLEQASSVLSQLLLNYKKITLKDFIDIQRLEEFDSKSKLQEKVMALHKSLPVYVEREIGHQLFEIDLIINSKKIKTLKGNSKKKIQRNLASIVLKEELYK